MYNLDSPLWQLTVGEFLSIQKEFREQVSDRDIRRLPEPNDGKVVFGLKGLSNLIGCSKSTALKFKNSGVIDKAVCQIGRKIIIDADLALELLKNKQWKKRSK